MQRSNRSRSDRVVYVVDGARTPFIKVKGVPGPFSASDLAVGAGKPLLARQSFDPSQFDQVIMGCVGPSEEEANIARIIALRIGCQEKVPAWTVQRNCASGLQAVDSAFQSIASGRCDLVLAGGCEAMSRAPLIFNRSMAHWLGGLQKSKTWGQKIAQITQFRPRFLVPIISLLKGLTDPVVNLNMGQTAQELAYQWNIHREEMDAFSVDSHKKAFEAQEDGLFKSIAPAYDANGQVYEKDDGVRSDSSLEKLAKLRPVFEKFGDITAGNSSQVSDGAAMVILASQEAVDSYDLPVMGKILDCQWAALDPKIMGLGPAHAIAQLMTEHQMDFGDIDVVEINEAFSAQVLACIKALDDKAFLSEHVGVNEDLGTLSLDKLNPYGGAIALGHPVGASGARLVLNCLNSLNEKKAKRAIASLCIGGGQGGAMLLERVER